MTTESRYTTYFRQAVLEVKVKVKVEVEVEEVLWAWHARLEGYSDSM
jgi:hypothetical protein